MNDVIIFPGIFLLFDGKTKDMLSDEILKSKGNTEICVGGREVGLINY